MKLSNHLGKSELYSKENICFGISAKDSIKLKLDVKKETTGVKKGEKVGLRRLKKDLPYIK